jgi:hypothetical protein
MKPELEPQITNEELDELFNDNSKDQFDSVPARLAFDFKKYGADYVRESLFPEGVPEVLRQKLIELGLQPDLYREDLIDAADELSPMGLGKVASIVVEVAETKASRFDRPCPWDATDKTGCWRESMQRERAQWELKRKWQAAHGRLWTGWGKVPAEKFWHYFDTNSSRA